MSKNREELGKFVRQVWIDYCVETGDTKPSHIAPWSALSEWDKEADRRIGEAVWDEAVAERDELLAVLRAIDEPLLELLSYAEDWEMPRQSAWAVAAEAYKVLEAALRKRK